MGSATLTDGQPTRSNMTIAPTSLMLATVQLRLLTPAAAVEAFKLVGLNWNPTAVEVTKTGGEDGYKPEFSDRNPRISTAGLYAWTVPTGRDDHDFMTGGIIYWGVGHDLDKRLASELKGVAAAYVHGHGMASHRTGARPVRGEVDYNTNFDDYKWVRAVTDQFASIGDEDETYERYWTYLQRFANDLRNANTRGPTIEKFGVRLSMHVGDVGAPVQSQHAGAWARDVRAIGDGQLAVADRVALLVAEHFRSSGRGA
jgi:hypothetical protein